MPPPARRSPHRQRLGGNEFRLGGQAKEGVMAVPWRIILLGTAMAELAALVLSRRLPWWVKAVKAVALTRPSVRRLVFHVRLD
ncbi:hypothetical protein HYSC106933_08830 [Hydrogenibacillus schlegelii]